MQQNKEFYNAWAQNYDFEENSTIFADEKTFPQIYLSKKVDKCLEIGCGSGRHINRLEAISNELTMFDISDEMMEIARKKSNKANTKFILNDILNFDFDEDEKFDLIIISLVIEHIQHLEPLFNKIHKLLKPMGRLCLSEIHYSRMLNGSGARFFDEQQNKEIRGQSFSHDEIEIENAAILSGLEISQKTIAYGNIEYRNFKTEWQKYSGKPMILVYEFIKP